MSTLFYLVPFVIGAIGVFQAGLNRRMTPSIGLAQAVGLNATIVFVAAIIIVIAAPYLQRWIPFEIARNPEHSSSFNWWFVLPGFFGLAIITGMPLAVARLGAATSFAILVAGQLITSLVWDHWMEALPITPQRIVGVVLACAAVGVQAWK